MVPDFSLCLCHQRYYILERSLPGFHSNDKKVVLGVPQNSSSLSAHSKFLGRFFGRQRMLTVEAEESMISQVILLVTCFLNLRRYCSVTAPKLGADNLCEGYCQFPGDQFILKSRCISCFDFSYRSTVFLCKARY